MPGTNLHMQEVLQPILHARLSKIGYFASVAIANADDASDPITKSPRKPLWRGHAMTVQYSGLGRID